MLVDGQEPERERTLYRFTFSRGHGAINFIPGDEFDITKDAVSDRFRMYEVKNEKSFKNGVYLELRVSVKQWNCYILPTGLPDQNIPEKNILATNECITKTAAPD